MNTKLFIVAAVTVISAASAASAFASEATPDYPVVFTGSISRAEVQRATAQALAAGLIPYGEHSVVVEPSGTTKTRAQVKAETLEAIRLGAISHGERSTFATPEQLESIRLAGLKALPMSMASR